MISRVLCILHAGVSGKVHGTEIGLRSLAGEGQCRVDETATDNRQLNTRSGCAHLARYIVRAAVQTALLRGCAKPMCGAWEIRGANQNTEMKRSGTYTNSRSVGQSKRRSVKMPGMMWIS